MSIAYATHGDIFSGVEPGCIAHLRDGSNVYHYVAVHDVYRPYFCMQRSVMLRVCQTLRKALDYSVALSRYAMLTAVIKALQHEPLCSPGGDASAVAASSAHGKWWGDTVGTGVTVSFSESIHVYRHKCTATTAA